MKKSTVINKKDNIFKSFKKKEIHINGSTKFLNSIRTKLVFAFLVPVGLIIILGVILYMKTSKDLIHSFEKSSLSTMSGMGRYFDFGLAQIPSRADAMVTDEVTVKYYSGLYQNDNLGEAYYLEQLKSNMSKDILSMNYVSNAFIFTNYGTGFSASGTEASKMNFDEYVAKGEGALLVKSKGEGVWMGSHPYLDDLSGTDNSNYSLSYMTYVYDIFNKPIGCIILNISYDYIMSAIKESGMPEGCVVTFITSDGREIVSGKAPDGFKFSDQKAYQEAKVAQKSEQGSNYINIKGKKYLFTYTKIDVSGSVLCSMVPWKLIVAKANEVKYITLIMVIMACVIAITLGTYIAYGYSNAIKKVNGVLQKTEAGDLTCYTSIRRKDEFHILGTSINDVIGSMQRLIRKMTGTSNTVSKSALVVSESSSILVNTTKNISESINDIENGVTQQATDAEHCLEQMADLVDKINELYQNTHNIEQIAESSKKTIDNGIGIVDKLGIKVQDANDITGTVINKIENLEMESREIAGIIMTINGIVEQTKLLSLNASIEAARAGVYGRGFSVVAQEIQKLADQSLKASGGIAKIIEKIETQIMETVQSAKNAEEIVSTQKEALANTVNVFTDINNHVENLTNNLSQIIIGVEGIEHAKNDTLRSIESISATTQETAAATEELGVNAMNQLKEVNKLNDVVQQLNDDACSMVESVCVFKISETDIIN